MDITDHSPLIAKAEVILAQQFGCEVAIKTVEQMSQEGRWNLLLRCYLNPGNHPIQSVILKKVEVSRDSKNEAMGFDQMRFYRDWVGTSLLNELELEPVNAPLCWGGDRALGFFFLEDIPHRSTLVEPLLGSDAASAKLRLLDYASQLGKMHCRAKGQLSRFEQLFEKISLTSYASKLQPGLIHCKN